MKLYGDNTVLADHLLETAFALLRNAGREPVDNMGMVYRALASGIDISRSQQDALHDYLRRVVADYDARR